METTIKKRLTGEAMHKAFNKQGLIRCFKANLGTEKFNPNNVYQFEITIRHNENQDPKQILTQSLKNIQS